MTEFGFTQVVLVTLETVVSLGPVYLSLLGMFAVVLLLWYAWPRLTGRDRGQVTTREYALIAFVIVLLSMPVLPRWLSLSLWGSHSLRPSSPPPLRLVLSTVLHRGGIPVREYAWLAVIVFCLPLLILSWFWHRLFCSVPDARFVLPGYRGLGVYTRARCPASGHRDFRSTPTDRKRPKTAAGRVTTSRPRESHHCNQWVMSGFPVKTKDTLDVK